MSCAAVTSPPTASIRETAGLLRRGALTCVELAQACLERMQAERALNALITILPEKAISEAKARDLELKSGRDRGPLHGIPIVHKDLFDTAGVRTTAGSSLFANRIPDRDATVVRNLAGAGAVCLGKANMNELAAGSSGKNVHYGDVCNPLDRSRSAGGSSSGSAAAVAAGLCLGATGSDTGGSIRIPAACTGLAGLRPGFGRLPLDGVTLRSPSLDTVGPIARSAADCALLFDAMLGSSSGDVLAEAPLAGLNIGVPEGLRPLLEPVVGEVFDAALKKAAKRGARFRQVRIDGLFDERTLAAIMDVMLYEFRELVGDARRDLLGPVVLANLEQAAGIDRKRYEEGLRVSRTLGKATRETLQHADVLALPVLVAPTPALDAPAAEFDRQRRLTLPLSATRLPIAAVPCGRDADGLPLGLQLVGRDAGEHALLGIAAAFESLTREIP